MCVNIALYMCIKQSAKLIVLHCCISNVTRSIERVLGMLSMLNGVMKQAHIKLAAA